MVAALEAVKGGETILRAVRTYGVPRSTLQGRGGPRVLTSSECVSILKEREEKKRIEAEVKEKRKIERERKKKEMAKCKVEERARKVAERSARLVKKSAPKAKAPVSKKRKVDEASSLEPTFENSASKEHNVDEDTSFESVSVTQRKKCKTAVKNDDYIDPNQYCVCFRTFEDGENWHGVG